MNICPLDFSPPGLPTNPSETCLEQCQDAIDEAIGKPASHEEYDLYPARFHWDECADKEKSDMEFSHHTIVKLGESSARAYVIVDTCMDCNGQLGEQGYLFTCAAMSQTDK